MGEQNYKVFWDEALRQIKEEFKSSNKSTEFELWYNLNYIEDTISTITVSTISNFMWNQMVSKKVISNIEQKINSLTGQNIKLVCEIIKKEIPKSEISGTSSPSENSFSNQSEISHSSQNFSNASSSDSGVQKENPSPKSFRKHPDLMEQFTFENFVPGENSDYAYNACLAAAKNPGNSYNPILLYGGSGLGKTHLMQAVGNYIYNENDSKLKIAFVSSESFTNEFIYAIKERKNSAFTSKYRNLDVLLIDDIQFLEGKDQTQDELFHTFNALKQKKAQMIFTCDRPISEIKGLNDRLSTRFANGLKIDLKTPNFETRIAILKKKLELMGKILPDDVIEYVAKNIQSNVRDLESVLINIIAYSDISHKEINIEVAKNYCSASTRSSDVITIETIQKTVASHYNLTTSDLKGKKRQTKFNVPRQIAIYLCRNLTEYSTTEIGSDFGGRDHSTVIHAIEKISELLKIDSSLNQTVQLLERECKESK